MIISDKIFRTEYPVIDNIVRALNEDAVVGKNKRYQSLYDGFARFYSLAQKIVNFWYSLSKKNQPNPFQGFIKNLGIKEGSTVLEVSVGAGDNIKLLPPKIHFYGIDISIGMLKQCAKKYKKANSLTLVHAMAESLPFKDESFDVVFHIGGINFFNDKAMAIHEMIRVTKPGTHFIIADETEKAAKAGERMFLARRFFKNRDEVIVPPIKLIPQGMRDIQLHLLCDDNLYVITFSKP